MNGKTIALILLSLMVIGGLVISLAILGRKEAFLTLSALNVANAETNQQLKYYDALYGYDPERWARNTLPQDTAYLNGLIFGYSKGADGSLRSLYSADD